MPKQDQIALFPITSLQKDMFNWKQCSQQTNDWIAFAAKEIISGESFTEDFIISILESSLKTIFFSQDKKKRPKQAKSAYIHFCNEQRPIFKEKHPDEKGSEITKLLAEQWKKCSDEEKEPYVQMWKNEKEKLEKDKTVCDKSFSDSDTESEIKEKKIKKDKADSDSKKEKTPIKKQTPKKRTKKQKTPKEEVQKTPKIEEIIKTPKVEEKIKETDLKRKTIKELIEYIETSKGEKDDGLRKLKKADLIQLALEL